VSAVISETMDTTKQDPQDLRTALADHIRSRGTFRTAAVEAAFRTVPRHVFLPGVDLQTAYASKPVVTKRADDGTAISSASSPNLVAEMLEQLDVRSGDRVLEIGAATGINAALLAELVGPTGHVVTIELDDNLAAGARASLTAAGYPQVDVICGDGALGHPDAQPYDRIIVTAGAWDIAPAWWDQLAFGGRLVVPLRLHGSGLTRVIAFDLSEPGRMTSVSAIVCGFVPLRGAAEHGEAHARLADDVVLHLDAADLPDHAALSQALAYSADTNWTGIQIGDRQAVEHLDLWLLTTGAASFGRLSVGRVARESGVVDPALRWAGAALYEEGTLAYLAMRVSDDGVNELGVVGHGPATTTLVARVSDILDCWDQERPAQPFIVSERAGTHAVLRAANHVVRPHMQVTIGW
jgi:protein-L-isoaspartate(D-aspartate) O-methyltransferase